MAGFNRDPNVTQIEHVYAICCRPEVAGDVFFGDNVKAFEGYAVLNFEVSEFGSFRYIKKRRSVLPNPTWWTFLKHSHAILVGC